MKLEILVRKSNLNILFEHTDKNKLLSFSPNHVNELRARIHLLCKFRLYNLYTVE